MRKFFVFTAAAAIAAGAVTSCKVSEKHYRQAYERAIAGDSARTDITGTIYGRQRLKVDVGYLVNGSDTLHTQRLSCSVAPDQAATADSMHRYNVCVASFKQRFNANSLRQRLEQNGYRNAMVLQTREPFYYVIAYSTHDIDAAAATLQRLTSAPPFRLAQSPFILIPNIYR